MTTVSPSIQPTQHWVLLRGLTRESGHWGAFGLQLQAALAPARVWVLDAPGCGSLHTQRSPGHVAGLVQALRAQLLQLQVPPPYHLLALSMGAMVAAHWSQHHPQEVTAQVWINTSMPPFNVLHERLRPQNYGRLLRLLLPSIRPPDIERTLWQLTSRMAPAAVVSDWLALRDAHPVSRANALRQLWAAARFKAKPSAPACPTLLLGSTQDALVNVVCSRKLAQAWSLPLLEHAQAGHDLPLDDPGWVIAQIQRWLEVTDVSPS